ncbi:hypothetical protein HYZ05_01690 [Candidatus Daviesbacteria bacterium]|nr:hypothetical protein [Candidatus Daviesbacteria bacterium]
MVSDDSKKIKELLEIISNKVGKLETHVSLHSATMHLIKDQQSVMNEKLDGLKEDVDGLKKEVKEMSENVDAARGDIELLHMDVKGIRDKEGLFHSRNKREIDEIKSHLGMRLILDTPEI